METVFLFITAIVLAPAKSSTIQVSFEFTDSHTTICHSGVSCVDSVQYRNNCYGKNVLQKTKLCRCTPNAFKPARKLALQYSQIQP